MRATGMAWKTPFPQSRMPASIDISIKLVVCLSDGDYQNEAAAGALAPPAHLTRMTQISDPPNSTCKRLMVNQRHCGIAGDSWNLDEGGGPELG